MPETFHNSFHGLLPVLQPHSVTYLAATPDGLPAAVPAAAPGQTSERSTDPVLTYLGPAGTAHSSFSGSHPAARRTACTPLPSCFPAFPLSPAALGRLPAVWRPDNPGTASPFLLPVLSRTVYNTAQSFHRPFIIQRFICRFPRTALARRISSYLRRVS